MKLRIYCIIAVLPILILLTGCSKNLCGDGSRDVTCSCKANFMKVREETNDFYICIPDDQKYEMVVEGYIFRDPAELPMNAPNEEKFITTRNTFWKEEEAIDKGFCKCIANVKRTGEKGKCVMKSLEKTSKPLSDPLGMSLKSCRGTGECWDQPCYDCNEEGCNERMIRVE